MKVSAMVPGNGLDELFGCERFDVRTMPKALMPRLRVGGLEFTTRMHKEVLTPRPGAKVLGKFSTGEPAIVENKLGKGRAIYIGSNPFLSYAVDTDPALLKWVLHLNRKVRRNVWTSKPDVIVRELVSGDKRLVFLLNTRPEKTGCSLHIVSDGKRAPKIAELLSGGKVKAEVEKGQIVLKRKLGSYGVEIFVIG
jgi:hypothetical protein